MQRYWLTTISVLMGAVLVIFPLLEIFFEEDATTREKGVDAPFIMVVGVLLLAGLWWLRTGRFSETVNLSLVGVGLVIAGALFFWLLLIPTVLALTVLWFGIVKRGLVTELRPAPGT